MTVQVQIGSTEAIVGVAANIVERQVREKPSAVLGLPTGETPVPVYRALAKRHRQCGLTFARVKVFLLDEYVGLPAEHPQRFRNVIEREFVSHVDLPSGAVRGLDGSAKDPSTECAAFERDIAAVGGVDLQLLGIGTNGHVAFNEPGSSLSSRTRLCSLAYRTRLDNAADFGGTLDSVPTHCLTQGLATIMEARHLVVIATGSSKAAAVEQLVEGPVSARWPASVLQFHPQVTVLVDHGSATRLELIEDYEILRTGRRDSTQGGHDRRLG